MDWQTSDTLSLLSLLVSVASAIYTGKTYLATVALKKHDSDLQLRLANETLRANVQALPALLEETRASHQAVLGAIGMSRSGAMQAWEKRAGELQTEIATLQQNQPAEAQQKVPSLEALKVLITETHALQQRALAVREELTEVLRQDERQRDHLREENRSHRAERALSGGP